MRNDHRTYNDAYNAELYPLEVVGGDQGGAVETLNSVTDSGRRGGTVFHAPAYRGAQECVACPTKIQPGDPVTQGVDGQIEHVVCPDPLEIPKQGVCPTCWLVLTPSGKCSGWCE